MEYKFNLKNDIIWRLSKKDNKYYFLNVSVMLILFIINIIEPIFLKKIINYVTDYNREKFVFFIICLIILKIICSLIEYFQFILISNWMININYRVFKSFLNTLYKCEFININKFQSSYLTQRLKDDISFLLNYYISLFPTMIIQTISASVVVIVLFNINSNLIYIIILGIMVNILMTNVQVENIKKSKRPLIKEKNLFFSFIIGQLDNLLSTKAHATFKEEELRMEKKFFLYYNKAKNYNINNASFFLIQNGIRNISSIIIVLFCGNKVISNEITIGDFFLINSYYSLLLKNASSIFSLWKDRGELQVHKKRITEILSIPCENNGKKYLETIEKIHIEINYFQYDDIKLLKDIKFNFNIGTINLIKGDNGKGKTTLILILLGLINQNIHGKIFYNDLNIINLDMYKIRNNNVEFISQKGVLTESVIEDIFNILKKDENDYRRKKLENLLNLFEMKEYFDSKTIDIIKKTPTNFSGGEMQKILLLKLFINEKRLIIMDEPTTFLDKTSINNLKYLLHKEKEKKICIIITHENEFDDISDNIIYIS